MFLLSRLSTILQPSFGPQTLLYVKMDTHLIANHIPETIFTERMVFVDVVKPHKTLVHIRRLGLDELIRRCPIDKRGALAIETNAGIVEVGFEFGDFAAQRALRGSRSI